MRGKWIFYQITSSSSPISPPALLFSGEWRRGAGTGGDETQGRERSAGSPFHLRLSVKLNKLQRQNKGWIPPLWFHCDHHLLFSCLAAAFTFVPPPRLTPCFFIFFLFLFPTAVIYSLKSEQAIKCGYRELLLFLGELRDQFLVPHSGLLSIQHLHHNIRKMAQGKYAKLTLDVLTVRTGGTTALEADEYQMLHLHKQGLKSICNWLFITYCPTV